MSIDMVKYWEYENGNRWHCSNFTSEQALKAYGSMTGCCDCVDCSLGREMIKDED